MKTRKQARRKNPATGLYYPNLVPLSAIQRYAARIADTFGPDKILLFGSYAYGRPRPDSDVDLLVVMRTNDQVEQAARIQETLEEAGIRPGFFMDLLVRTPRTLEQRLRWGDWFLREVVTRGKVLYEKADRQVAQESGGRRRHRAKTVARKTSAQRPDLLPLPTSRRKVP
jgi:predicted nucleotidyltransferase